MSHLRLLALRYGALSMQCFGSCVLLDCFFLSCLCSLQFTAKRVAQSTLQSRYQPRAIGQLSKLVSTSCTEFALEPITLVHNNLSCETLVCHVLDWHYIAYSCWKLPYCSKVPWELNSTTTTTSASLMGLKFLLGSTFSHHLPLLHGWFLEGWYWFCCSTVNLDVLDLVPLHSWSVVPFCPR